MAKWLKRIGGSIAAAVLAVLGAGDREELFKRAADWSGFVSGSVGAYLSVNIALGLLALGLALWAWDVPTRAIQKWREKNDPDIQQRARLKRQIAELRIHLSSLYTNLATRALGDLAEQVTDTVSALGSSDSHRRLVAGLLMEVRSRMNSTAQPVLDWQAFETVGQRQKCIEKWAELYSQYQTLAWWLHEVHKVTDINPWGLPTYDRWREADAKFVDAFVDMSHMDHCTDAAHVVASHRVRATARAARPPA